MCTITDATASRRARTTRHAAGLAARPYDRRRVAADEGHQAAGDRPSGRSDRLGETALPKRIALPIFASDALSSVTYATQEILLVLTARRHWRTCIVAPWVAGGVVLLFAVVVASYRQVVRAYPSGGGDYEVATKNLGRFAGLVVASALLVDYVLTVAVSVAAGVDNIISAIPDLNPCRVGIALGFVALLAAMNLRGVRESGTAFAIPTYAFIAGVLVLIVDRAAPGASSATRRRPRAPAGRSSRSPGTSSWPGWRCCSSRCARSPPAAPR